MVVSPNKEVKNGKIIKCKVLDLILNGSVS